MAGDPLKYHQAEPSGKLKVVPTKPCTTAEELSLAYTPGVALPCLEIKKNPQKAYDYTAKGNLVAVISNGTAVLGLGNSGPLAGKPVMEGKSVLFKRFANVDAFDLEINELDPDQLVKIVASLEPTFGGINLEDIKAPECFYVEEELIKRIKIPVFHDDQHGTAVITAAALTNALKLVQKDIKAVKIVFSGAGAAAIACAKLILELGAVKKNIFMFDSKGILTISRQDLNSYKKQFAREDSCTLAEALHDADVFIGVSKGNILTAEMIKSMSARPIVFAMANPTPEISYEEAKSAVSDIIIATGRSDYPNQVNNVLGFPFIFRGALDVQATTINLAMKMAAVKALSKLALEPVSTDIVKVYGRNFSFGHDYIIPKPFDLRLLPRVASTVAKAAMDSGVARKPILDFPAYEKKLQQLALKLARGEF